MDGGLIDQGFTRQPACPYPVDMTGEDAPKYRRLADDLRTRIRSGEYAPGSQSPSKSTLMQKRRLSLGTVNKAIGLLADEGLVEPRQGSGTFVCDPLPEEGAQEKPDTGEVARQVTQLHDDLERIEFNLIDLYGKLGFDYPRDGEAGDGTAERGNLAQ